MKRLVIHFIQILVLFILLILFWKVPLNKIPYLGNILSFLIFILFCVWGYFLWKKRHIKLSLFIFLAFNLVFSLEVSADFCSKTAAYERTYNRASQNNWAGDKECDSDDRLEAREILDSFETTPTARWIKRLFYPDEYKKGGEDAILGKSFLDSPYFNEVVTNDFKGDRDAACASLYTNLCSLYDGRHPSSQSRTVKTILLEENASTGCWPCKMSYIILTVVQKLSSDLSDGMRGAAKNALKIFLLVWFAYSALTAVVFPGKSDEFLKQLITKMLGVSIAFLLLSSNSGLNQLYKDALSPFLSLGIGISDKIDKAIYTQNSSTEGFDIHQELYNRLGISSETSYCPTSDDPDVLSNIMRSTGLEDLWKKTGKGRRSYEQLQLDEKSTLITEELQVNLLCMTQKSYNQFSPMTAVGQSLISFAGSSGGKKWGIQLPSMSMFFIGLAMVCLFCVLSFFVAFRIVDIFLRLGFVLVLMPLFVAAIVFSQTRFFAVKGFTFLLNVIVEFLSLTIIINFVIVLIQSAYSGADGRTKLLAAMVKDYSEDYGTNLLNALTSGQNFRYFFFLIGVGFMSFLLFSKSDKILSGIFGTTSVGGAIVGGGVVAGVQQAQKAWSKASNVAEKTSAYKAPEKDADGASGKEKGEDKKKDKSGKDSDTKPANQRHFDPKEKDTEAKEGLHEKTPDFSSKGEETIKKGNEKTKDSKTEKKNGKGNEGGEKQLSKTGKAEKFHFATQKTAEWMDKIGVNTGQFLQKHSVLGLGSIVGVPLTLGTKVLSTGVRTVGKTVSTAANLPNAIKNSKIVNAFKEGSNSVEKKK